jgi:hypothetical protein
VRETVVEQRLRTRLKSRGWLVLKLVTPGTTGAMDRMILAPVYAPMAPMFVELKRPGLHPTAAQAAKAANWRSRGATVLNPISTIQEVDDLVDALFKMTEGQYGRATALPIK